MHVGAVLLGICLSVAGNGMAQPGAEMDSLLATWPVREARLRDGDPRVVSWTPLDTTLSRKRMMSFGSDLPMFQDDAVADAILLFGGPRRNDTELLLAMAAPWMPMVEKRLKDAGLSSDLKYLPLAVSAMNMQAASNSGEAGPWMLTFPVALRYGLMVNDTIDERHDMERSTQAAIAWLKDLDARFGREGALLAYLCGPANLVRARQRAGDARSIEGLYPFVDEAQRHRVPTFMALRYLARFAGELGLRTDRDAPATASDTVRINAPVRVDAFTRVMRIDAAQFASLNPMIVGAALPANTVVRVPRGAAAGYAALADSIVQASSGTAADTAGAPVGLVFMSYLVEPGDNLGAIAEEYGASVAELMEWNELDNDRLRVGQLLRVRVHATPVPEVERAPERKPVGKPARTPVERNDTRHAERVYVVRRGDTLSGIAKRYPGITVRDIMRHNGISDSIRPGQKLKIPGRP